VYSHTKPTPKQVKAIAAILEGTALVESGLRHVRQTGYGYHKDEGAWGLWQVENISVAEMRRRMDWPQNAQLYLRAAQWLFRSEDADPFWFAHMTNLQILQTSMHSPRLSCLLARMHYIRVPKAIPEDLESQAKYYVKWYNICGKATYKKYLEAWNN
jgi:hypothetical protein